MKTTLSFQLFFCCVPIWITAQTPDKPLANATTFDRNSPVGIAKEFSVSYGVRQDAVLALLECYGSDRKGRKEKVKTILEQYSKLPAKTDRSARLEPGTLKQLTSDYGPDVVNALEWDLFAGHYFLTTFGENSPAIVATGSVNIWYGMDPEALRKLATLLERQDGTIEDFRQQLDNLTLRYRQLKASLNVLDATEKKVGDLMAAGKFEEADAFLGRQLDTMLHPKLARLDYIHGILSELLQDFEKAGNRFETAVMLAPDHADYRRIFGQNLAKRGRYSEAVAQFEQAIRLDSIKSRRDSLLALDYNELGLAYHQNSQFEPALKNYEQALTIYTGLYPKKTHSSVAQILNNIGSVYLIQGNYSAAQPYLEEALQIDLALPAVPHSAVGSISNNLGLIYVMLGDQQKGLDYLKKALASDSVANYLNINPDVARDLNNIGEFHAFTGDYKTALSYYETSLWNYRKVFPAGHPATAIVLNNMGAAKREQGLFEEAIGFYKKGLNIALVFYNDSITHGRSHPDIARFYSNIGSCLASQDKLAESLQYFQLAFEKDSAFYAGSHLDLGTLLNNLGFVWFSMGDYDKALYYYNRALDMDRHFENSVNIAGRIGNIGMVYDHLGRYETAIDSFNKALALYRKIHQHGIHPDIADMLSNIGMAYFSLKDYDRAFSMVREAFEMDSLIFGMENPNVALGLSNLAAISNARGEYDQAIAYANRSLAINLSLYPKIHTRVAKNYNILGISHFYKGAYHEAISFLQLALEITEKLESKNLFEQANLQYMLALAYNALQDDVQVVYFLEKALAVSQAIPPGGLNPFKEAQVTAIHCLLAESAERLAVKYSQNNDFNTAKLFCQKALSDFQAENDLYAVLSTYKHLNDLSYRMGECDTSMYYFRLAVEMTKDLFKLKRSVDTLKHLPDIWFNYGLCLQERGEKRKARPILRKSKKLLLLEETAK